MKTALLFLSLLGLPAFAAPDVDPSGCSPLIESAAELQTRAGALLTVRAFKPRNDHCWNVNEAAAEITYRWAEEGVNATGAEVHFWLRVNGHVLQAKTAGNCKLVRGGTRDHRAPWYDCRAAVLVPVLHERTGRYRVEVAPRKAGAWDTWGFERNYHFEL